VTINIPRLAAILAMALIAERTAISQSLQDPLLDHLVGSWVLRGDIAHKQVTHAVKTQWVLAHQYIQIRETSQTKTADGAPEYDAIIYVGWDPDLKQYSCLWLDSTGGNGLVGWALGHAEAGPDKLSFLFSDKNGAPSVRNTFTYDHATNTWRWVIDNFEKGELKRFANVTLTRQ
jgi:hypothetical protein